MSFPRILALITVLLFGTIALVAVFKDDTAPEMPVRGHGAAPIELKLNRQARAVVPPQKKLQTAPKPVATAAPVAQAEPLSPPPPAPTPPPPPSATGTTSPQSENLPEADRMNEIFSKGSNKLTALVETVIYKSRVPWMKDRQAWLADYASHYQTSRHFIARSLNGKTDYFKQDIAEGDKFNVLRNDKKIEFYLVIDLSRCKMWLYALDTGANERTLLKTYRVGLGRVDSAKTSGLLTPLGKYTLGNKIAIYKPKMMGYYNGERVEMVSVFGSRWIPFDKEVANTTAPAKGFGIHGVPWTTSSSGESAQDLSSLGKYQSDGCVRLASEDIEEIFAIIITKPSTIELVKDFRDARLPGTERN